MEKAKITCDEIVYHREPWGHIHGSKCGRPAKENGKCGLHCESAVRRREEKAKLVRDAKSRRETETAIRHAINRLKKNGYKVISPSGEDL